MLSHQIRDARKGAGLTQIQAARSAGISAVTVRYLERGYGTLKSLYAVLDAYGCEIRGRNLPAGDMSAALTALRKRRAISRRSSATVLNLSRTTLAALERGGPGRLETLEAYGAFLGAGLYIARRDAPSPFFTHAGVSSNHHGWETPAELVAKLESVFGRFDLDPCASTSDARRARLKARVRLTVDEDGLSLPWRGNVFVNPPYGRTIGRWVCKCAAEAEAGAIVVGLVPARTDARWWHEHVAGQADIFMLRGRLRFGDGKASAPFPSVVLIWGGTSEITERMLRALPDAWHIAGVR